MVSRQARDITRFLNNHMWFTPLHNCNHNSNSNSNSNSRPMFRSPLHISNLRLMARCRLFLA
jgi:hypothetical protein